MIIISRDPQMPPPVPPVSDTGDPYRYELTYSGDYYRAYADSLTELCSALIEGYDPAGIAEQLRRQDVTPGRLEQLVTATLDELRIVHAVSVQVRLQADINTGFDLDDVPAEQVRVLRGDRVTQPAISQWDSPVPLVLSTHDYQPDGDLAVPDGNIIWLDPRDEAAMLTTFQTAGLVRLAEHDDREEEITPVA